MPRPDVTGGWVGGSLLSSRLYDSQVAGWAWALGGRVGGSSLDVLLGYLSGLATTKVGHQIPHYCIHVLLF